MLFNTLEFALFLPLVFALYWAVKSKGHRVQNAVIAASSYVFYGWWDWRFTLLIALSTLVDFQAGRALARTEDERVRKRWLVASLAVNLGMLATFKYANFFLENFVEAFRFFGQEMQVDRLNIILPVGISFYTFQTLSYTIDVYRRKIEAEKDPIAFTAFVSFFPQLVAGPIERASNLLPQFAQPRHFDRAQASDGMRQILWGLFKKIVIADQCAPIVDYLFEWPGEFWGITLLAGAVFFAFQIYADFSGYSDIAIGTAKLFNIRLMQNFATPYFARDIADFWRRWHISLSTWFRDYLYIPMGGSRATRARTIRNVLVVFIVSGFWHGASWNFIVWGALHGLLFLPLLLGGVNRKHMHRESSFALIPSLRQILEMGLTFTLVTLGWVFFRAPDLQTAWVYLSRIAVGDFWDLKLVAQTLEMEKVPFYILFMLAVEWMGRIDAHPLQWIGRIPSAPVRYALYYGLIVSLFWFGNEAFSFIYFQF